MELSSIINTIDGRTVTVSGHPDDVDRIVEVMQAVGPDANVDCLVQHPADEPPDNARDVLTLLHVGDGYHYWRENNYRRKWLYDRECVVSWCELPLIKRSNDV